MIALIHLNTSNNENSLPIKEASLIYRELMCAQDNLDNCVCVYVCECVCNICQIPLSILIFYTTLLLLPFIYLDMFVYFDGKIKSK